MGNATFVATSAAASKSCTKDSDCMGPDTANGVSAATTTDKAKRCCLYYLYSKAPTGTALEIQTGTD
tara:strand:+ start:82 stop:282 length:201 start_codon:yes stop_codon:yes gene_type:complete